MVCNIYDRLGRTLLLMGIIHMRFSLCSNILALNMTNIFYRCNMVGQQDMAPTIAWVQASVRLIVPNSIL